MAKNYIVKDTIMEFNFQTIGSKEEPLKANSFAPFELPEEPEDLHKHSIEIDGEKYLFAMRDGDDLVFTKDGTYIIGSPNETIYLHIDGGDS